MGQVEQTIATPFEDFDLVIETFDKAAVGSVDKEIGNFLPPMGQGFQKIIKASQLALFDPFHPGPDLGLSAGF
jgi:hypothetical protein